MEQINELLRKTRNHEPGRRRSRIDQVRLLIAAALLLIVSARGTAPTETPVRIMPVPCGTPRTRWCARRRSRHTGLTPPISQQGQRFEPRQLVRRGTAVGCSRFWPPDRMAPPGHRRLPRSAHTPVTFLGANCPRPAGRGRVVESLKWALSRLAVLAVGLAPMLIYWLAGVIGQAIRRKALRRAVGSGPISQRGVSGLKAAHRY